MERVSDASIIRYLENRIAQLQKKIKFYYQGIFFLFTTLRILSIMTVMSCNVAACFPVSSDQFSAAIAKGMTTLGYGKLTVNTSGGLKACGHPVGATGVKQIAEIVAQLRGEADKKQVAGAKFGLTHNVGGTGAVAVVHIFSV